MIIHHQHMCLILLKKKRLSVLNKEYDRKKVNTEKKEMMFWKNDEWSLSLLE